MRYYIILICFLSVLLCSCAGRGKMEVWICNQETKVLEHQATLYSKGKIKGEVEITKDTIKAGMDSKQPGFLEGAVKNLELQND